MIEYMHKHNHNKFFNTKINPLKHNKVFRDYEQCPGRQTKCIIIDAILAGERFQIHYNWGMADI